MGSGGTVQFLISPIHLCSTRKIRAKCMNVSIQKKSSGRVLLIHFLEVVLMFKSSVVLSLVESVESVLKTDRLAVVSCVRIS
jgi:hypothetical protein